ncbi:hypothetical protein NUW54_g10783 [Trametes sanguinea]|uniref:Uncharacterized protein n=1 Tax=Trametes sanguinea TaxID=158606 RepID=A0ACC1NUF1_9APHY|nr:hypothetical protein NUW54_g10783 [Trametes sanguinea]
MWAEEREEDLGLEVGEHEVGELREDGAGRWSPGRLRMAPSSGGTSGMPACGHSVGAPAGQERQSKLGRTSRAWVRELEVGETCGGAGRRRRRARTAARATAIVTDVQSGGRDVDPCRLDTAGEGPQLSPTEELNTNVAEPDGESDPMADSVRIHTHYRVVVKDVCLPFTEISSSKQLVSGIMDCIRTHSRAYDHLRLLHRDVSAENVMIRPSLSSMVDGNGMKTVEWKGILTDWELAKEVPFPIPNPNDPEKSKEIARKPERTGTWQFMSVACIQYHPFRPVSVADELESFFHVLLFYAIRLLHHNAPNARFFVTTYFDSYSPRDDGTRNASDAKWIAMRTGKIEM